MRNNKNKNLKCLTWSFSVCKILIPPHVNKLFNLCTHWWGWICGSWGDASNSAWSHTLGLSMTALLSLQESSAGHVLRTSLSIPRANSSAGCQWENRRLGLVSGLWKEILKVQYSSIQADFFSWGRVSVEGIKPANSQFCVAALKPQDTHQKMQNLSAASKDFCAISSPRPPPSNP